MGVMAFKETKIPHGAVVLVPAPTRPQEGREEVFKNRALDFLGLDQRLNPAPADAVSATSVRPEPSARGVQKVMRRG